ncbi:MAG: RnfABCDGE type electron transport complex subunit B [Spirochaetales bacterium]|nr:RnfABCDGE type electron transport complex subunit B [Spirochaetales bacterium]
MVEVLIHIVWAFLVVGGLGVTFGLLLSLASRLFAVKKDMRTARLEEALPGLNCGACGFAGCVSYAEAIVGGEAALTLCTAGGSQTAEKLAGIMGVDLEVSFVKKVAQVLCRGGEKTVKYRFEYNGIKDCNALFAFYDGNKVCTFGCLGLGSCIRVCPVAAIDYDDENLVWVDGETCIGCGKCIEVCPTGVMQFLPHDTDFFVACRSTDKGAAVRKYCSVGCIGCKVCEKQSPEGGFIVENNLARIDYRMRGDRSAAAQKCPPKCIIRNTIQVTET